MRILDKFVLIVFLKRSLPDFLNILKISPRTVSKIWKNFCHTHAFESKIRGGDFSSKLTARDLELIETLKAENGYKWLTELASVVAHINPE